MLKEFKIKVCNYVGPNYTLPVSISLYGVRLIIQGNIFTPNTVFGIDIWECMQRFGVVQEIYSCNLNQSRQASVNVGM